METKESQSSDGGGGRCVLSQVAGGIVAKMCHGVVRAFASPDCLLHRRMRSTQKRTDYYYNLAWTDIVAYDGFHDQDDHQNPSVTPKALRLGGACAAHLPLHVVSAVRLDVPPVPNRKDEPLSVTIGPPNAKMQLFSRSRRRTRRSRHLRTSSSGSSSSRSSGTSSTSAQTARGLRR